jgi:hypothetical protein
MNVNAQRSRAERLTGRRRWAIAAFAAWVGVGALFGGYGLLADAENLGVKDAWLEGTPLPDYRVPGLVLLVVIGGGMLVTVLLALRGSRLRRPRRWPWASFCSSGGRSRR